MDSVWVLVVEHQHGFNHYVNKSKEGMLNTLAEYCREWWDDLQLEEDSMPENRGLLIEMYFDHVYDEWYTCDLVTVHD